MLSRGIPSQRAAFRDWQIPGRRWYLSRTSPLKKPQKFHRQEYTQALSFLYILLYGLLQGPRSSTAVHAKQACFSTIQTVKIDKGAWVRLKAFHACCAHMWSLIEDFPQPQPSSLAPNSSIHPGDGSDVLSAMDFLSKSSGRSFERAHWLCHEKGRVKSVQDWHTWSINQCQSDDVIRGTSHEACCSAVAVLGIGKLDVQGCQIYDPQMNARA